MSIFEQVVERDRLDTADPGRLLHMAVTSFVGQFSLREFVFSQNRFEPSKGETKEFSDIMIFIDGVMIIIELKARDKNKASADDTTWLKNQVEAAKKQHKNSLRYWEEYENIDLTNHRGHRINIREVSLHKVIRLFVYLPSDVEDEEVRYAIRHSESSQIGFMHVLHVDDFFGILLMLVTPYEVIRYLDFRKELISKWREEVYVEGVPEECLTGQFINCDIAGGFEAIGIEKPKKIDLAEHAQMMLEATEVVSRTRPFFDQIGNNARNLTASESETSYYNFLSAFAKLHRTEFKAFDKIMTAQQSLCSQDDFNRIPQCSSQLFFNLRTQTLFLFVAQSDCLSQTELWKYFNHICNTYKYFLSRSNYPLKYVAGILVLREKPGRESLICFLEGDREFDPRYEDAVKELKLEERFKQIRARPYYQ